MKIVLIGMNTDNSRPPDHESIVYIWSEVFRRLDYANSVRPISKIVLVDGKSPLTDAAYAWAEHNSIPTAEYVATYKGKDRTAPSVRNRRLIANEKPDQVIAMTWYTLESDQAAKLMLEIAGKSGVETHHIDLFKSVKEF